MFRCMHICVDFLRRGYDTTFDFCRTTPLFYPRYISVKEVRTVRKIGSIHTSSTYPSTDLSIKPSIHLPNLLYTTQKIHTPHVLLPSHHFITQYKADSVISSSILTYHTATHILTATARNPSCTYTHQLPDSLHLFLPFSFSFTLCSPFQLFNRCCCIQDGRFNSFG